MTQPPEIQPPEIQPAERAAMAQARSLGDRALGRTSPNPPVGAVILSPAGEVVGTGYTQPAGSEHAEVMALRAADGRAHGGTAVVTLEPCNHTGRTGPCSQALLDAGIRRVIYAVDDPTPVAAGGAARLRQAGVEVVSGFEAAEAATGALRWWLHSIRAGRPAVVWKYASTLDGRVAAVDGTSRWISGSESRADVHRLRDRVDAVLVGSATVLADDPALTVRDALGRPADRQPLRVVLDRRGRIPATARVLDDSAGSLVLDQADPLPAMAALFARGIRSVLLEGGPTLAGAFLKARCIDEVVAYLAPALLGAGPAVLADAGVSTIAEALRLDIRSVERSGADLKLTAVPVW